MQTCKKENFSRKRLAILNLLKSTTCHPTADWIYEQLKPKFTDLSLGTVYRNLKKFCQTGKIVSIGIVNGQERFDAALNPHSHFICDKCGAVCDIDESFFDEKSIGDVAERTGMKITRADVVFMGVCGKCG